MLLTLPRGDGFDNENITFLYAVFKRDFIDQACYIRHISNSFPITVKPAETCYCPFGDIEKPKRFWHIITKTEDDRRKRNNPCPDTKERNRGFCSARAKRLHWIKFLIDNWQTDPAIVHYYQTQIDGTSLIIWHRAKGFLIILSPLSNSTDKLLVTSYIVFHNKQNRYKKEYKTYEENKPTGEEWFV